MNQPKPAEFKYVFKPGDVLIYKPTNTPFIVIKVTDYIGYDSYTLALQNGIPGVPKQGNMRFIKRSDIFKTYEPKDETIKLLYVTE